MNNYRKKIIAINVSNAFLTHLMKDKIHLCYKMYIKLNYIVLHL